MSVRLNSSTPIVQLNDQTLATGKTNKATLQPTNSGLTVESVISDYEQGKLTSEEAIKKFKELGAINIKEQGGRNAKTIEFDLNGKHYKIQSIATQETDSPNAEGIWDKLKNAIKIVAGILCPPLGFVFLGLFLMNQDSRRVNVTLGDPYMR